MASLEKAARAAKAEIGRQLSAQPLLGNADSGDWHAAGDVQEIDLTLVARAVLLAVRDDAPSIAEEAFGPAGGGREADDFRQAIDQILQEKGDG